MPAPASGDGRFSPSGEGTKWLIAAVLPLAVAAGYWGFSQNNRHKIEQSRGSAGTAQILEREIKPAGQQRPSGPPAEPSESLRGLGEPVLQVAIAAPRPSAPLADTSSAAAISPDGLYIGPICYGPGASEPPRCFRAQGTIAQGRIAGQWPGRDPGMTMFMVGEVTAAGGAQIRIDAARAGGIRSAAIDLSGTLQAGRLDAAGSFRNGRTATLNWRKQQ